MNNTIAVLHGDQTGEELLKEALRILEPGVLGIQVETRDYDLSLEERRKTRNQWWILSPRRLNELCLVKFIVNARENKFCADIFNPWPLFRERTAFARIRATQKLEAIRRRGGSVPLHGPQTNHQGKRQTA